MKEAEDEAEWQRIRGVRLYPSTSTRAGGRLIEIIPEEKYGMDNALQAELARQIRITGGFPRGRQHTWYREAQSQWSDVHWEIARTLRRGAGTFYIEYEGAAVDLQGYLPVGRAQLHIQLRNGEYPTGDQRPRSRSRDRSRSPGQSPVRRDSSGGGLD